MLLLFAVVATAALHAGTARAAEPDSVPLAIEIYSDGRTRDAEAMRWLGHAAEQGRPIAQRLVNRYEGSALASR